MERFKQKLLQAGIPFRENEPLAAHCTFKIGGPAQLFVQPQTEQQLCSAVALCKEQAVRYYLLGNGSNILFADEGFAGVVIDISALGSDIAVEGNMLTAGAGVRLAALCRAALEHGLSGLEFAYGIPGTVGGAVAMNAGSFGTSTAESLDSVEIWSGGRLVRLTPDACETGYRHFRPRGLAGSFLVVSAVFRLSRSTSQDVAAGMQHNFQMKKSRQPITARSAGCVFRNPACGVSAGALLERAGFRGRRKGSVALSEQHANFLVNLGGGTSAEALALLEEARTAVRAMAGVELDFEVRFLPCLSS